MSHAAGALATAAALALLSWFLRGDRGELTRFKWFRADGRRIVRYRLWVARGWLAFGIGPAIGLLLLGRIGALSAMPPEFVPLAVAAGGGAPTDWHDVALVSAIGATAGIGLLAALTWWRRRRGRPPAGTIGDTSRIMPRSRADLPWGAAMALTAGIAEEVMFRLFLPLAITLATGSAAVGFVLATACFAGMHRYQGWAGMAATGIAGGLLAALYLLSGALWLAMAYHVAMDLTGLVIRPLLAGAWRRTTA